MPLRRVTADMERFGRTGGRLPDTRFGFHLNLHDRADGFLFGRETKRLFGPVEVRETLAGVTFLLSPTSFFQTNVRIAALLVDHVLRLLPPEACPRVLDLYSGVGLFALPLARRGQEVTAVEENRHAVAAADAAVRFNRLPEGLYRPVSGRVEAATSRLDPASGRPGVGRGCPGPAAPGLPAGCARLDLPHAPPAAGRLRLVQPPGPCRGPRRAFGRTTPSPRSQPV